MYRAKIKVALEKVPVEKIDEDLFVVMQEAERMVQRMCAKAKKDFTKTPYDPDGCSCFEFDAAINVANEDGDLVAVGTATERRCTWELA